MKDFHRRLAKVALAAVDGFGFVLAGGYAISAHGIGDRPSMDVDLFTSMADPALFRTAVDSLRARLTAVGWDVTDRRIRPLFADLRVSDPSTGDESDLQLGVNYREYPPARIELGPVLDVRDAVAGKMSALWSRGEARDFIDIDAVLLSGRFTADEVLALGDQQESTSMDRQLLSQQFRAAARWPDAEYSNYGVDPANRSRIVARFTAWADQIDPAHAPRQRDTGF